MKTETKTSTCPSFVSIWKASNDLLSTGLFSGPTTIKKTTTSEEVITSFKAVSFLESLYQNKGFMSNVEVLLRYIFHIAECNRWDVKLQEEEGSQSVPSVWNLSLLDGGQEENSDVVNCIVITCFLEGIMGESICKKLNHHANLASPKLSVAMCLFIKKIADMDRIHGATLYDSSADADLFNLWSLLVHQYMLYLTCRIRTSASAEDLLPSSSSIFQEDKMELDIKSIDISTIRENQHYIHTLIDKLIYIMDMDTSSSSESVQSLRGRLSDISVMIKQATTLERNDRLLCYGEGSIISPFHACDSFLLGVLSCMPVTLDNHLSTYMVEAHQQLTLRSRCVCIQSWYPTNQLVSISRHYKRVKFCVGDSTLEALVYHIHHEKYRGLCESDPGYYLPLSSKASGYDATQPFLGGFTQSFANMCKSFPGTDSSCTLEHLIEETMWVCVQEDVDKGVYTGASCVIGVIRDNWNTLFSRYEKKLAAEFQCPHPSVQNRLDEFSAMCTRFARGPVFQCARRLRSTHLIFNMWSDAQIKLQGCQLPGKSVCILLKVLHDMCVVLDKQQSCRRIVAVSGMKSERLLRFCLFKRISISLPSGHAMKIFMDTKASSCDCKDMDKYFSDDSVHEILESCNLLTEMFPVTVRWFKTYFAANRSDPDVRSFVCQQENLNDDRKKVLMIAKCISWWVVTHIPTVDNMNMVENWCVPEIMMASSQFLHQLSVISSIFVYFLVSAGRSLSSWVDDLMVSKDMKETVIPGIINEEYMWDSTLYMRMLRSFPGVQITSADWKTSSDVLTVRKMVENMLVELMCPELVVPSCLSGKENYKDLMVGVFRRLGLRIWFDAEMQVYGHIHRHLAATTVLT